jgi:hypothetical protein
MSKIKLPPPNRVAAYLTALAALAGALAPVVGDLDLTSTIGVLGGLTAILGVFREWLKGWREHEYASSEVHALRARVAELEPSDPTLVG